MNLAQGGHDDYEDANHVDDDDLEDDDNVCITACAQAKSSPRSFARRASPMDSFQELSSS